MTENEVRDMLRQQVKEAGSYAKWAHPRGYSDEYARNVALGRTGFSVNFCRALGLRKVVTYAPLGREDNGRSPARGAAPDEERRRSTEPQKDVSP